MSKYYTYPSKLLSIEKGGLERVEIIEDVVSMFYGVPKDNLKTKRRKRDDFSEPFHVVCTLIIEFTNLDRRVIGEMYGRKRCSTYHAEKAVSDLEFGDYKFRQKMEQIRVYLIQKFIV